MWNIKSALRCLGRAVGLALTMAGGLTGSDLAAATPQQRPDFNGYWTIVSGLNIGGFQVMPPGTPRGWRVLKAYSTYGNAPPPLKPGLFERLPASRQEEAVRVIDEGTAKCLPPNNFDMMTWGDPVDVIQRADEIAILPEKERALPRRIYIGGKHPANLQPSPNGNSVGHWEGDTLVSDTTGIDAHGFLFYRDAIPHSADLHVSERIHLEDGGKTLVVQWTIEDPKVLTKPWPLTVKYDRAPPATEAIEAVCDLDGRR
jgi:hypothetical protein